MEKIYIQEKLIGSPGQVVSFDSNNKAILKTIEPQLGATLHVTAPAGNIVTATDGISTISVSNEDQLFIPVGSDSLTTSNSKIFYANSGNSYILNLPRTGTWTVTCGAASKSVNITSAGDFYVTLSFFTAYIGANYSSGFNCICTNGATTLTATNNEGYYLFEVPSQGTWTVMAYNELAQATETVYISSNGQRVEIVLEAVSSTLEDNSWEIIKKVTLEGQASQYWALGDKKQVILNGTIGTVDYFNEPYYAYIIGFDHNASVESDDLPSITFQLAFKNSTDNSTSDATRAIAFVDSKYSNSISASESNSYFCMMNVGSVCYWKDSPMRNYICSSVFDALPTRLQNCLGTVLKYSADGHGSQQVIASAFSELIFLPSEKELLGQYADQGTPTEFEWQELYDYYSPAVKTSRVWKNKDNTTPEVNCKYWTRSKATNNLANGDFIAIDKQDSSVVHEGISGIISLGITPCFVIGGLSGGNV